MLAGEAGEAGGGVGAGESDLAGGAHGGGDGDGDGMLGVGF